MPSEAKREAVASLKEELSGSTTLIISEYRGLNVTEIAQIRRSLDKSNVSYRVVKNRLMRIAALESGREALSPLLDPFWMGLARSRSSNSRARFWEVARSTPTRLRAWLHSRRATCSFPRSLVPSRRPWPPWPVCSRRRCVTWLEISGP